MKPEANKPWTNTHFMICQDRSTCVPGKYFVSVKGITCVVCRKELDPNKEYPGVKFTVFNVEGRRVAKV
jgi:hypothetical protein